MYPSSYNLKKDRMLTGWNYLGQLAFKVIIPFLQLTTDLDLFIIERMLCNTCGFRGVGDLHNPHHVVPAPPGPFSSHLVLYNRLPLGWMWPSRPYDGLQSESPHPAS